MAIHERRQSLRQTKKATVQVLPASDNSEAYRDTVDSISGQICNQSDGGVYIEIDRGLIPGSNVRLEMIPLHRAKSEEAYLARDGRVVRCGTLGDKSARFGVGIKILRKVVKAPIMSSRFK